MDSTTQEFLTEASKNYELLNNVWLTLIIMSTFLFAALFIVRSSELREELDEGSGVERAESKVSKVEGRLSKIKVFGGDFSRLARLFLPMKLSTRSNVISTIIAASLSLSTVLFTTKYSSVIWGEFGMYGKRHIAIVGAGALVAVIAFLFLSRKDRSSLGLLVVSTALSVGSLLDLGYRGSYLVYFAFLAPTIPLAMVYALRGIALIGRDKYKRQLYFPLNPFYIIAAYQVMSVLALSRQS